MHQSRPIPESLSSPRVDRKAGRAGSLSMHPRFMTRQYRRRRLARTKGAPAPRRHFPHAKGTSHPHPSCRPPCASSRRPAPVANTRFATWRKLISGARDAPTRSTRFVRFARDGGDDGADDPDIARPWRRSRWGRKMRAWTIARGWDERVGRRCALSELRAIDRARREGRARPRRGAHARWMIDYEICLSETPVGGSGTVPSGRARLAGDGAGSIVRSATDGVKGRKK